MGQPERTLRQRAMSHELPFLAVTGECGEDPNVPGLCDWHEVYHLDNGNDLDICRGEIPRRT